MRSKLCCLAIGIAFAVAVPANGLAQDTNRFGLAVGLFTVDESTPRLESQGIFVGNQRAKFLTGWIARRVASFGYLELSYRFVPVEQTVGRIAGFGTGNVDPRASGPAYETPLNIHAMLLELRRPLISFAEIELSIAGGGGLIYIDPGRNHALPGAGSMRPEIEEFDSLLDPVLSFGGRVGIPVRERLKLTVDFRDNLHFCNGEHDRQAEGGYLCTLGTGLNHYEVNFGAEVRW